MTKDEQQQLLAPPLQWRIASTATIAIVGMLSKAFLNIPNTTTVYGLEGFVKLLDERKDPAKRERGLITVSNHVSVVDDPVMWGVLPFRHMISPKNTRWSLGSHDICFTNRVLSTFFILGQTLPTHRLAYSPHGGLFQPTITQAIRLLSNGPFTTPTPSHPSWSKPSATPLSDPSDSTPHDPLIPSPHSDPFTDPSSTHHLPSFTYTTNQADSFPSPSVYFQNRHAWLHIFPEGQISQNPGTHVMRYHKWGIARLVLEAEPCPDVVPLYVSGMENVMPETRKAPRWLPRVGNKLEVRFGDKIERSKLEKFRERWSKIREGVKANEVQDSGLLMHGKEAVKLRIEVTKYLRGEVDKLRRESGEPAEDERMSNAEFWKGSRTTSGP